jgi:biotin carboxyl carrier protein
MIVKLVSGGREYQVDVSDGTARVNDRAYDTRIDRGGAVIVAGRTAWTVRDGDARWGFIDGRAFELSEARPAARRRAGSHHGAVSSPMPATVRRIAVAPGDSVKAGDLLIVLEAMKMELPVRAAHAATVLAITCREGELVQPGVPLIELSEG